MAKKFKFICMQRVPIRDFLALEKWPTHEPEIDGYDHHLRIALIKDGDRQYRYGLNVERWIYQVSAMVFILEVNQGEVS
ncbi:MULTISPECIES: hypothetical protein [Acidithiobacillus]|uniref:Uncharacterized protein n=2 Tax=Acidithiobacillus TaxID=119977 RepID=A0A179BA04_ACIFR|nr:MULTISPECIES: hypothetical protein [Acidithiobacillus]MEB8486763.1 hypothetical protein [Acidithiobacillus ferriphilus]MEB8488646.1 hypothetical protein [Acidithiobacillus ferriphilus]MEB8493275.1 hypothetical protein [Acidithiobacillus ferriphilus]MEB8513688.1 hypothetical protein [Acidithiobacillus ferriphilus]MEB8522701.1 hypothetical protein [Acidithiobacillus ferriphilus]